MSKSRIEFSGDKYAEALRDMPDAVSVGAREGLKRVKSDWLAKINDGEVPVDTGNLQKSINGTSDASNVVITANADDGYGFNYAYYVHEVSGNKFMDRAFDEAKAKEILEREIGKELARVMGG